MLNIQALSATSTPQNLNLGLAGRSACVLEGGFLIVIATKRRIAAISLGSVKLWATCAD